jgi:hypothetical protein
MYIGDRVIYIGDRYNTFNLFIYGDSLRYNANDCLVVGEQYKITEMGIVHPSHIINRLEGVEYCKVEGCVFAFPCDVFTQYSKKFTERKYNLK